MDVAQLYQEVIRKRFAEAIVLPDPDSKDESQFEVYFIPDERLSEWVNYRMNGMDPEIERIALGMATLIVYPTSDVRKYRPALYAAEMARRRSNVEVPPA